MSRKPIIAITQGDINGISYEVILKLLRHRELLQLFTPIVYGSAKVAAYYRKVLELDTEPWIRINSPKEATGDECYLIDTTTIGELLVEMGKTSFEAGKAALEALELAFKHCQEGLVDALVTAPINKAAMPQELFPYNGHTAYLAHKCSLPEGEEPLMILMEGRLKVALATEHIPIAQLASSLSVDRLVAKIDQLRKTLVADFAIDNPRIAVLALNPHAGDQGRFGHEEQTIILPAIEHCQKELGINCMGPFPADGFWGSPAIYRFDALLAMYHDQGLAPFKALAMERGVNFTAGLPIVRTSPDHGTGYDIVGKGVASETSLKEAIYVAMDIVKKRREHQYYTRNPLKKLYYATNKDNEILPPLPEKEE